MNNEIIKLEFNKLPVRTFNNNGSMEWCASDVCKILGYANAPDALIQHCKTKGIAKRYTPTDGGMQEMSFINESNLYRLIMRSRMPDAEAFQDWVTEEILPAIRKNGSYSLDNDNPQDLVTMTPMLRNAIAMTAKDYNGIAVLARKIDLHPSGIAEIIRGSRKSIRKYTWEKLKPLISKYLDVTNVQLFSPSDIRYLNSEYKLPSELETQIEERLKATPLVMEKSCSKAQLMVYMPTTLYQKIESYSRQYGLSRTALVIKVLDIALA